MQIVKGFFIILQGFKVLLKIDLFHLIGKCVSIFRSFFGVAQVIGNQGFYRLIVNFNLIFIDGVFERCCQS